RLCRVHRRTFADRQGRQHGAGMTDRNPGLEAGGTQGCPGRWLPPGRGSAGPRRLDARYNALSQSRAAAPLEPRPFAGLSAAANANRRFTLETSSVGSWLPRRASAAADNLGLVRSTTALIGVAALEMVVRNSDLGARPRGLTEKLAMPVL